MSRTGVLLPCLGFGDSGQGAVRVVSRVWGALLAAGAPDTARGWAAPVGCGQRLARTPAPPLSCWWLDWVTMPQPSGLNLLICGMDPGQALPLTVGKA